MTDLTKYGVDALTADEAMTLDGGLPGTGCPACDGYPFPFPRPYPSPWPGDDIFRAL